ncbi:hypothetical protein HK099_008108 [Clydaea vesicula]|uniref:N-acetyltransferase domain-containing protein n=1 Tax=Clydaea vesicula TaxID=447962 RepID=A0AAD5TVN5_9FUNG|nr:hypothetical protein HK099_008108 [Clydaea vesicula]KAJ3378132.1 hypothetical protein HDU92_007654 [Lobulomyces angularis]
MFTIHNSKQSFLDRVEKFLLQKEALNNIMLGILYGTDEEALLKTHVLVTTNNFCLLIQLARNSLLCSFPFDDNVMMKESFEGFLEILNNYGFFLPKMSINDSEKISFELIIGSKQIVHSLIKHYDLNVKIKHHSLIYECEVPKEPKYLLSGCRLRKADVNDIELISFWFFSFSVESLKQHDASDYEKLKPTYLKHSRDFIEKEKMYICEIKDGDKYVPVSMAAKNRKLKNFVAISYVYTPPEFRRKSYASNGVFLIVKECLGDGYKCCLFANKFFPTANKIYQDIGFVAVNEIVEYHILYE